MSSESKNEVVSIYDPPLDFIHEINEYTDAKNDANVNKESLLSLWNKLQHFTNEYPFKCKYLLNQEILTPLLTLNIANDDIYTAELLSIIANTITSLFLGFLSLGTPSSWDKPAIFSWLTPLIVPLYNKTHITPEIQLNIQSLLCLTGCSSDYSNLTDATLRTQILTANKNILGIYYLDQRMDLSGFLTDMDKFPQLKVLILQGFDERKMDLKTTTKLGEAFKFLPNLTALSLSGNKLSEKTSPPLINGLKYLPKLKILDFSLNTGLQSKVDDIFNSLNLFPCLQVLNLGNTGYKTYSSPFPNLQFVPDLRVLILNGNELESWNRTKLFEALKSVNKLIELNIGYNTRLFDNFGSDEYNMIESVLTCIPQLRKFEGFASSGLKGTKIEQFLKILAKSNMNQLTELNLQDCKMDWNSISGSLGKFPNVTSLNLSTNSLGHCYTMGSDLSNFPKLKHLNLGVNSFGGKLSIPQVCIALKTYPLLESLNLVSNALNLDDCKELSKTFPYIPKLKSFSMFNNLDMGDEAFIELCDNGIKHLINLTNFEASSCKLTDLSADAIIRNIELFQKITILGIKYNSISIDKMNQIHKLLPKCRII